MSSNVVGGNWESTVENNSYGIMVSLMSNLDSQRSTKSNCNVTIDEEENITCSNHPPRVEPTKFGLNKAYYSTL